LLIAGNNPPDSNGLLTITPTPLSDASGNK
jgi:hypothetical protein